MQEGTIRQVKPSLCSAILSTCHQTVHQDHGPDWTGKAWMILWPDTIVVIMDRVMDGRMNRVECEERGGM
jgi:hypothetical protein